jgi:hypothetical protein
MAGFVCSILLTAGFAVDEPNPADLVLTPTTVVRFATPDEGRTILTTDDAFTASLSRFDLQCRLKSADDITLADWKRFVAQHVRPWEPGEIETALARVPGVGAAAVVAMQKGASDYLPKRDLRRLPKAIATAVAKKT